MRCIALAAMIEESFEVRFVCREIPDSIRYDLCERQYEMRMIETDDHFLHQLSPGDFVVLDGYNFDTGYQKKIREAGCILACIDDVHDREFDADLIINHAPGVSGDNYTAQPHTRFALGPDYALLRPAFLQQAKKRRRIASVETLLICFGGSDVHNLTERTVRAALDFDAIKKIIIIAGSSYRHEERLQPILEANSNVEFHQNLDEKQMVSRMLEADLAIVPASGILFEALAAGCYVISGLYTENQNDIYTGFKELNTFVDAKNFEIPDIKNALSRSACPALNNPIDGKSGKRILSLFQQLRADY